MVEQNFKNGYLDELRIEKIISDDNSIDSTYFKMGMRIWEKRYFSNKKLTSEKFYKNDTLNGRFKLFINEGDDLMKDLYYEMGEVKEIFKSPNRIYEVDGERTYNVHHSKIEDFLIKYPKAKFLRELKTLPLDFEDFLKRNK